VLIVSPFDKPVSALALYQALRLPREDGLKLTTGGAILIADPLPPDIRRACPMPEPLILIEDIFAFPFIAPII
jgi:hypothetical protein